MKHGRKAKSLVKYGLEEISSVLLRPTCVPQFNVFVMYLNETYISGEIPINNFKESDEELYVYRTGYGFFNVYDISFINNSWRYSYYHPRYQYKNFNPKGGNKYKGYSFTNIISSR